MTAVVLPAPTPAPAARVPGVRRARLIGPASLVAALVACAACASAEGTTLGQIARALLAIAVTQVLPGALLWRLVRPRDGWLLEDVVFGFALGVGLAVPAQAFGGHIGHRWPAVVLPLAVAALVLVVPSTRARVRQARWSPVPWWLGAGTAATSLVALPQLINFVTRNQLRWAAVGAPQPDQHFHMALAGELLRRGPSGWPMVAGEDLGYHWFGHAWIAQICAVSGVPVDQVALRVTAVVMPLLVPMAAAALALRLSQRPAAAVAAAAITMAGGQLNVWNIPSPALPINPESFTLGLSATLLMATAAVLAVRWRGHVTVGTTVSVPVLTVLSAGTKGSTVPLLIAGTALAAVVMLWQRRPVARLLLVDLALMTAALVLTLKVVFNGSAGALTLNPEDAAAHTFLSQQLDGITSGPGRALSVGLMILGGLTRAALGFGLLARRGEQAGRRDPVVWLLLGAVVAGCCAPAVFVQPGQSQYYFMISAYPLAAVASGIAVVLLVTRLGRRTSVIAAAVAVATGVTAHFLPTSVLEPVRSNGMPNALRVIACAATVLIAGSLVGAALARTGVRRTVAAGVLAAAAILSGTTAMASSLTQPLEVRGPATARSIGAVTSGEVETAWYIRNHSGRHDVVASNRHCAAPGRPTCESRRFLVAAYTERQVLLEGWAYTPTISRLAPEGRTSLTHPFWDPALQRLNDGFYRTPTAGGRDALWDKGVRWLYVDNAFPHRWLSPYADRRFTAPDGTSSAWLLRPPAGVARDHR
ncbi:hypothetical protein [Luteipulveratus halotolerans]|uniref:Uncharacterized protein n=1 Tax=Luteipulveratus halotolerans TaxID=1631356 RepID=A0A0L6CM04_9MICO|nr:hypothetical protein [Luteipulveratus halotolerans]KNX38665.1 hypothetical protein VV01_18365 [Luteipulveratus halotolerans]